MEGAVGEAPAPGYFPLSRSLSTSPPPCRQPPPPPPPLPGTAEPHGPKMAASRLPPLHPGTGSDDIGASKVRQSAGPETAALLLLLGATRCCWTGGGGAEGWDLGFPQSGSVRHLR
uniref:SET-binding protein-like n=1 Tax=Ictidomys tridecemlineatus TaxID=43179 RepID=UPI001A9E72EC|nr:SET-binding protein-like [Ictidomys tridecemlineatus]